MARTITILLPHGELPEAKAGAAPRLESLAGKRIGFLDNDMWRSMHILVDELAKVLTAEYGAASTEIVYMDPKKGALPKQYVERLETLSQRVDAVVAGLGN